VSEKGEVVVMGKTYESLMEGLMEDLQDNQTYGKPQGRETVIEMHSGPENHEKQKTALDYYIQNKASLGACAQIADMSKEDYVRYLGANGISIFRFDDEREFVDEMNNA